MDKQQVKEIVPTLVGLPVYVEHDVTHRIGSVVESKIIFGSGIEVVLHIQDAAAIKALEENQYLGLSMSHRFSKKGVGPVVQEAIEISVVRKGRREGSWIREIEFVAGVHNCSASQEARHHIYRTAGALCSIGGYTMQPTKISNDPVSDRTAPLLNEVVPPVVEVVPPVAEVLPPVAEVVPPVAEVVPPVAEVVPPVAEVVPPVAEVVPPVAEVVPPVTEVVPPVTEVVPPVTEVVPPETEVVPPVSAVEIPVAEVVPPVLIEAPADGTALLSAAATEIEELRNKLAAKTQECIMNAKDYQESKAVCRPTKGTTSSRNAAACRCTSHPRCTIACWADSKSRSNGRASARCRCMFCSRSGTNGSSGNRRQTSTRTICSDQEAARDYKPHIGFPWRAGTRRHVDGRNVQCISNQTNTGRQPTENIRRVLPGKEGGR